MKQEVKVIFITIEIIVVIGLILLLSLESHVVCSELVLRLTEAVLLIAALVIGHELYKK